MAGSLLAGISVARTASAKAATCANPVACENALPGTPQSTWDVGAGEGSTIQGFADPFSVNVSQSINFKIQSPATAYKIDIYRMGYYGGDGARLEASITPNITVSQKQPACNTNTATGLVDCGNWGVSATWSVPATAVSGVYFAHIYRTDQTNNPDENQIPFVVTNKASTSNIVYMTTDETWEAYNDWGGYSLYTGDATDTPHSPLDPGRAEQVSYNRPFATRFDTPSGQDYFFNAEFPMIEFMEKNGYDVSYVSQQDVGASGGAAMLEQHKMLVNAGHSEYWDAADRTNVTAARNAGVNLAFFAANLMWWKTRFAPSQFGNEPNRTLISYKESLDSAQTDPADPPTWTGSWRDPRFDTNGNDGGQPENALTGQLWEVNCCSYAMQVPAAYSKLRIWRNSTVAGLATGQTATFPDETLGYEWDVDVDNGFRPAGEIDMSSTSENVSQLLLTNNEQIGTGNVTNSLTLYRAASGALVFDAGTVQWAWGLDNNHDGDQNGTSSAMQQATVNLFADMGAQPTTLDPSLTAATASTDHTAPTSAITVPAAGATIANGATTTVSGTATDSGGGVVAGVEVSTDGGSTWHPVTTMSAANTSVTWSYTWSAAGSGSVKLLSRATDDSANIETPGPGISVTVSCPCGLFGGSYTPAIPSTADPTPYELGMKFQSTVAGWVAGVRFYKGAGNAGTHTGSLWSSTGTQLATGTFTNETATGWQSMKFTNPVQIAANTTYVVSYYDPDGNYASDLEKFDWQLTTPPLIAPRAVYTTAGGGNGVFNVGGPGFPTGTSDGTSYGVDVIFDTTQPPGAPPTVASSTPVAGSSSVPTSTDPTVTFSKPVVPSTASFTVKNSGGTAVAGTTSFDSTDTIATFTPTSALAAGTTYTVTVSGAQDSSGQAMTAVTYTFTTSQVLTSGTCPCAIWPDAPPAGATDANETNAIELGVQFTPAQNGTISGVRFFKESDNTGTHTGTLWSASGTALATGTFTSESTQGWEQLNFATPVQVTAGTTYTASYHTTTGHYADTGGNLSAPFTSGLLTVPVAGGVYLYGASGFPTNTFNGSNYWVDVVYNNSGDTVAPTVTGTTPASGATSVPVTSAITVTFSKQVKAGTASFTVTGPGGTAVPGTASLDTTGTVLTFTPTSSLSASTAYSFKVSGAANISGVAMPTPYTSTFTTSGSAACPCTIFESDATPSNPSANDTAPVELGVKFSPQVNGWVSGVRFYKGAGNTGTHTGGLWSDSGTQLATGTFTNETASGWQTLTFATPVQVTSGTNYIVGYNAPNGHYSVNSGYFAAAAYNNPPLSALKDGADGGNGLYSYGGTQLPTSSFGSANYWVDPIFWTTQPPNDQPPTATPTNPVNGQTSVPTNTSVSFTFSKPVQSSTIQLTLTSGEISVPGVVAYNSATNTGTFTPTVTLTGGSALSYATTYTATLSGSDDAAGTPMGTPLIWSFTTAAQGQAGVCPCSIWPGTAQPATASADDSSGVTLGVKFTSDEAGYITGIRFYKGAGNGGTHIGDLWDSSGNLLGQVDFTNESAAGWQEADFASPVHVTANTTYVASYFAPNGGYSVTSGQFSSVGVDSAPLHALSTSAAGGNGLYLYGSTLGFPTNSFNGTNYWVDVVFTTTAP
jgi:methionine-rich copper-binding protein CopC